MSDVQDYSSTSFSRKAHPFSFVGEKMRRQNIASNYDMSQWVDGSLVRTAGPVLIRQRPDAATWICFITIEDETGVAKLVVFRKFFDKYRSVILPSRLLMVEGKLQKEGEVRHMIVQQFYSLPHLLTEITATDSQQSDVLTLARADENDGKFPAPDERDRSKKPE